MDVKWLMTKDMGSMKTVEPDVLPAGKPNAPHKHPNAEKWEYVLARWKRVGDAFVIRAATSASTAGHLLTRERRRPAAGLDWSTAASNLEEAGTSCRPTPR
jgi:hypothetical protein